MTDLTVHHSSHTAEHYTPAEVLRLTVACMGKIDLDPCADPDRRVPAALHYTAGEDGLSKAWAGRVFMNPPYGRAIGLWVDRLVDHYQVGKVTEAISLVPARVDTAWWHRLTAGASLVLFWRGRLRFVGNDNSAPFPSALVYMGDQDRRFIEVFGCYGDIWRSATV